MTALRDALTQVEDELASGIAGLAERIQNLPQAEDITQADIDALRADARTLEGLAATSTTPVDAQPVDANGNPIEVPVEPTIPVPTESNPTDTSTEGTTGTDTSGGTTSEGSQPTA